MLMRGRIGWIISVVMLIVSIYVAWRVGDRVFDYAVRAHEDGDKTEYLGHPPSNHCVFYHPFSLCGSSNGLYPTANYHK